MCKHSASWHPLFPLPPLIASQLAFLSTSYPRWTTSLTGDFDWLRRSECIVMQFLCHTETKAVESVSCSRWDEQWWTRLSTFRSTMYACRLIFLLILPTHSTVMISNLNNWNGVTPFPKLIMWSRDVHQVHHVIMAVILFISFDFLQAIKCYMWCNPSARQISKWRHYLVSWIISQ